jgi:hypothetical protein
LACNFTKAKIAQVSVQSVHGAGIDRFADRCTITKENVLRSVTVKIKQCQSTAQGFEQKVLSISSIRVHEFNTRFLGNVGQYYR